MAERVKCLSIRTPQEWRAWLAANHAVKKEAWLTIYKKHSAEPGVRLAEAVEEALCFGWIDGLMHSLGPDTFELRFAPRRSGAVWSAANQRRVKRLIKEGRMTKAGLAAVRRAKRSGEWRAALLRKNTARLPPDLRKALAEDADAKRAFTRLAPSKKEQYIWWIAGARKPETRLKRIREMIRLAMENERPARS